MSDFEQATFFRTDDLEALKRVIRDFCSEKGLVETPYVRGKRENWGQVLEIPGRTIDRWAVALGTGQGGWSIVKTLPRQLLDEQPGPWFKHRIGFLARALGCDALHVTLQHRNLLTMEQAALTGEVVRSSYAALDGSGIISALDDKIHEGYIAPRIEHLGVPRSVFAAFERSPGDGFDELLEQLAGRQWADVSRALVEGDGVPFARMLMFVTRPLSSSPPTKLPPSTKPPLRMTLAVELHSPGTRYVLDGGVWVEGNTLRAANAEVGAAFVGKVAHWLGVRFSHETRMAVSHYTSLPSVFVYAEPRESVQGTDVGTEVLSIGSIAAGAELLLHVARGAGTAELEQRGPNSHRGLISFVSDLAHALIHAPVNADAAYRGFECVVPEGMRAGGTFAGECLVTTCWRRGKTAVAIEGKELRELPGLCTAMAGTPGWVALALVTPDYADEHAQGYAQESATVIVVIDVDTGQVHEVLRSDAHLTFGYTLLCFAGDVLGVRAERAEVPVIVTLDQGKREERPGDFQQWMREALRVSSTLKDLYSTDDLPILPAGPHAVVVGRHRFELAVLDLRTTQRLPLCDAGGLEPLAFSASGSRCLATTDGRRLFVGSAAIPSRPPSR
ncbi:hypothetical protein ATI61_105699 [Archangium gephyra]|uniref:Uncharacterized protein n=1 Tax=Archangium gephyra TaxID=48 RepID=A0AAC8THH1_9BACT|nr:hypothetical protein [Archangium gephyra]AKJ06312.1 Hypothetical protein AA314_07938 [Archangium gephyra]REG32371.1 hypothetical protein ATI61_105699 [Archangium gephyra]